METSKPSKAPQAQTEEKTEKAPEKPEEFGGPKGLEPTRYGDWDINGRCSDF